MDRLVCPGCGTQAKLELWEIREPERRCYNCKTPWAPAGFDTTLFEKIVTVTSSDARAILEGVPDEAGHWDLCGPERVHAHAEVMRAGEWVLQSERPIEFDAHGFLMTGLLRLLAVVETDIDLVTWMRWFDPIVEGHVPFRNPVRQRKERKGMPAPALLRYWQELKRRGSDLS